MAQTYRRSMVGIGTTLVVVAALVASPLAAQQLAGIPSQGAAKQDAVVVVDGVARQVFRNVQASQIQYVVQIEVQRSEVKRTLPADSKLAFPAPGQLIYVQVVEPGGADRATLPRGAKLLIPNAQAQVRAYLVPAATGGWSGTYPDWFDGTAAPQAEAEPGDAAGTAARRPWDRPTGPDLGMTIELVNVQGHPALKVSNVQRGGPAQQAGLEDGDLIVAVNGKQLTNVQPLEDAVKAGKPFSIVVADVRTGRVVQVDVDPEKIAGSIAAARKTETPADSRASLGISAESVSVGFRSALKVTRVEPDSPAAKAGIEPDDIIVEANGAPITGPEQLVTAVRKSGPTLELTVRDSRTGRNTPVQVNLGGRAAPPTSWPPASSSPGGGAQSDLGAVTELAFHNDEFAVKISEVAAGSPAARAGLQPGMLILKVNDKPVLHPTEVTEAIRQAGRTAKLEIADPRTGRTSVVNVTL